MRRTPLLPLFGLALFLLPASARAGDDKEVLGKKSGEWLKILLEDERPRARRAAVKALEIIGPKADRVLPGLTLALQKDADAEVRREAAQALGGMGEDAKLTIPALAKALSEDKDGGVREAAARALGGAMARHSGGVVTELARALKDSHPATRTAAAATLKDMAAEAKPALPQVIDFLKDKGGEPLGRVYAVQLVGRLPGEAAAAVPALAGVIADGADNAEVRAAAAEALGRFKEKAESAAPRLAQVAGDAKAPSALRQKALMALGQVSADAKTLWPAVRGLLLAKDSALRGQAVRVAGPLGKTEKEVVELLQKVARDDGNVEVRVAAIQELGELGPAGKTAEKTLTDLADDPRPSIRAAATVALKRLKAPPAP